MSDNAMTPEQRLTPEWHDPEIFRQAAQLGVSYREMEALRRESPPWEFDSPEQCREWVRDTAFRMRGDRIEALQQNLGVIDELRAERDERRAELDGLRGDVQEIIAEYGREARQLSDELSRVTEERDALLLERDRGVPDAPELDR